VAEATQNHEDQEVFILKEGEKESEEKGAKPAEAAPARKITPKQIADKVLRKIADRLKSPLVWGAGVLALIALFFAALRMIVGDSSERVWTPPPLLSDFAIEASMDDRQIIAMERSFSTLENQLSKAALLYGKGNVEQALDIYEQVSLFSGTLSLYNLGVARMRQGEYAAAIEAFDAQIEGGELKTPGAINAAACALQIGDESRFNHYVAVAKQNLAREANSPIFGFYYAAVNYYDNSPFKALIAADRPTIDYLQPSQDLIAAKMRVMFSDTDGAIKTLEKIGRKEDLLTIGLLYARNGDWSNAAEKMTQAMNEGVEYNRSRAALILTHLKSGFPRDAGALVSQALDEGANPLVYPIRVKLRDSLFDINEAQEYFSRRLLIEPRIFLQVLFNYTPYIIVVPTKGITDMRKGQAAIASDEIAEAENLLSQSSRFSPAGAKMSAAVKLAIAHRITQANKALAELEREVPNLAVLEYNLALSYAQLGELRDAQKHFRRAYFLDKRNTQAGVYAAILAPIAGVKDARILGELQTALHKDESEESLFLQALLSFNSSNFQATSQWLGRKNPSDKSTYLLLELFAADQTGRDEELKSAAKRLTAQNKRDLLSGIFEFYAEHKGKNMKQFAFEAQSFMDRRDFDFDTLYHGAPVARELYSRLALISGNLRDVRAMLEAQLIKERKDAPNLMQSLAFLNIYLQDFEQAYTIMNAVIDEFGVKTSRALRLGAIGAIGAGHKENAIALLQMAKKIDPTDFESRYALGLLYHEAQDARGAALEYSFMSPGHYESRFFDFEIRPATDPLRPDGMDDESEELDANESK
jgi:tetratricopeptide (TPR) repeat protein